MTPTSMATPMAAAPEVGYPDGGRQVDGGGDLLADEASWAWLQRAVAQRVALLDLVLGDLYGRRSLVRQGHIPLELVYGQTAFLRPCQGTGLPHGGHLLTAAIDVAPDATGALRSVGDRVQVPDGLGRPSSPPPRQPGPIRRWDRPPCCVRP